jgi:N6-L-threonylcarbamoyladenine synthase
MHEVGKYELLAQTNDDAIGEAFDKVAKMMGLPYPGGPHIESLAKKGDPYRYAFTPGRIKRRPLDFSFSGIKTGVLYTVKGQNGSPEESDKISESDKCDIAASFQRIVFEDVIGKTLRAASEKRCRSIIFGGGVTNNNRLKEMFREAASEYQLYWPSTGLSLDNAAMIAGLGYHQYRTRGCGDSLDLEPKTRIAF